MSERVSDFRHSTCLACYANQATFLKVNMLKYTNKKLLTTISNYLCHPTEIFLSLKCCYITFATSKNDMTIISLSS